VHLISVLFCSLHSFLVGGYCVPTSFLLKFGVIWIIVETRIFYVGMLEASMTLNSGTLFEIN